MYHHMMAALRQFVLGHNKQEQNKIVEKSAPLKAIFGVQLGHNLNFLYLAGHWQHRPSGLAAVAREIQRAKLHQANMLFYGFFKFLWLNSNITLRYRWGAVLE